MRNRRRPYRWQRQRREAELRRERVAKLKADVKAVRLEIEKDPGDDHAATLRLRARLRVLQQQIRYINSG
jgi:hypothetical protein